MENTLKIQAKFEEVVSEFRFAVTYEEIFAAAFEAIGDTWVKECSVSYLDKLDKHIEVLQARIKLARAKREARVAEYNVNETINKG